jgi:catechol 2,3-dioxygenase-like lactoylglutathione lyase family enzyme
MGVSVAAMAFAETPRTIKVDHASVCGSALKPLQDAFASVGLATNYGGPHGNGITEMALLGFDDGSYLELIAPRKPGVIAGSNWEKALAADAGPCAWAIGSSDISADIARFKQVGIPIDGPEPGSRKRPDGQALAWVTASVGGADGAVLPFMIEDKTPHALRAQVSESVHGSVLTGIAVVVIGVKDLDANVALFRKAYGWGAPSIEEHKEFGAKLAYFSGTPVVLAVPLEGGNWLAQRIQKLGDAPVAYLFGASDFGAAGKKYGLAKGTSWFGRDVGWFDAEKLRGMRLGVVGAR